VLCYGLDTKHAFAFGIDLQSQVATVWRPGGGQDHHRQFDSAHPGSKGCEASTLRPHRSCNQAHDEATSPEAKTIHRLLEVAPKGGGFRRDAENLLDCNLIVVDETSMVDVMLMHALLEAVPERSAMLVVGDVDQLPSVGPGQVLADA
jgi:AAA domain